MSLAHKAVAFVLISVLAFCNRVSHGFRPREKFGLKARLKRKVGKSWPKVAVGGKAMIFLFGVKARWFSGCYSGLLDPITVVQASFTRSFCVASTDYQRFLA